MNRQTTTTAPAPRRQRADGRRSRDAILDNAARLATVDGLEGLSIGSLAEHTGMSKSGLYAHFTSKEDLQLATIQRAQEIFEAEVLTPARAKADGLHRLWALSDEFLSHLERQVFPAAASSPPWARSSTPTPGPSRSGSACSSRSGWGS